MLIIHFLLRRYQLRSGVFCCWLLLIVALPVAAQRSVESNGDTIPLLAQTEKVLTVVNGFTSVRSIEGVWATPKQQWVMQSLNGQLHWFPFNQQIPLVGATATADMGLLQWPMNNCVDCIRLNATLLDSAGHQLLVQGQVQPGLRGVRQFDLQLRSNNFNWLNTGAAFANQLYGVAHATTSLHVGGNSERPVVSGDVVLTGNSQLTLVLPQINANRNAAGAVVRFIDRDKVHLPEPATLQVKKEELPNINQYLQQNLAIHITPETVLNIIIDPSAGDALQVQGNAALKTGIDSAGNMLLSGKYQLDSGAYTLNNQFLRRQFLLLPGSTIDFAGRPADAVVNLQAVYEVNTSAETLIGNEIGSVAPSLEASFKKPIPFQVILHMKGALKKPAISFSIALSDQKDLNNAILRQTVQNKLKQLQEDAVSVNKQVFSLLLMDRFVGEQSTDFFKGSGPGFNDISRESVSKFLSSALDNIAADIFKGLDIEMKPGTYRDYSNGDAQQQAAFNMAVTKSFINNRLSITVGRNFGVEGQDANAKAAQQKGLAFLPDVTSSLQLTAGGKYLMRAYKKSPFEVVIDGTISETGLGFIIRTDYDTFRDITRRHASTNAGK